MFGLKKRIKPAGGSGGSDQELEVKDLSDQVPSTTDATEQIAKVLRGEPLPREQRGCGCW